MTQVTPAQYRKDTRRFAATTSAIVVAVATVAGGVCVARAIDAHGLSSASPMTPVTRRLALRSVTAVIEERLAADRLKVLLGIVESKPAPGSKEAALLKIGQDAGELPSKTDGADYLTSTIRTRSADLARAVADLIPVRRLAELRVGPASVLQDVGHRTSRIEAQILAGLPADRLSTAVTLWIRSLESEPSLRSAWRVVPGATGTLDGLVTRSLDLPTLRAALAARIASNVSLPTLPKTEVELASRDLAARLVWGITAVLFFGLWVAAMSICAWQIWTLIPRGHIVLPVTLGLALVTAVATFNLDAFRPDHFELLGPILAGLEAERGTQIIQTARVLSGLAVAALVVLLVASTAVTWVEAPDLLESQLEGLRTLFNAGAALLVAGALEIAAVYSWVEVAFDPTLGADRPLNTAALLAAAFAGTLFSTILMVVYLPTVTVLRDRAKGTAAESAVAQQGLSDSFGHQLMRLLQALAPLLAAVPLTGLTTLLGE